MSDAEADAMAAELFHADYTEDDPAAPWVRPGIEGVIEKRRVFMETFPDFCATVDRIFSTGDDVVARWSVTGTHKAEVFGIAPTGRTVNITGISIVGVRAGKVATHTLNWDALGMLRQLGGLPE